jgi:hypothetical protein
MMYQIEVMTDKAHYHVVAEGMNSMKRATEVLKMCQARIPEHSTEHFRIIKVIDAK